MTRDFGISIQRRSLACGILGFMANHQVNAHFRKGKHVAAHTRGGRSARSDRGISDDHLSDARAAASAATESPPEPSPAEEAVASINAKIGDGCDPADVLDDAIGQIDDRDPAPLQGLCDEDRDWALSLINEHGILPEAFVDHLDDLGAN